jgi:hypothetical protein
MDGYSEINKIVDFCTDYDELLVWAKFWDIEQDPHVQLRLLELRCNEIGRSIYHYIH